VHGEMGQIQKQQILRHSISGALKFLEAMCNDIFYRNIFTLI